MSALNSDEQGIYNHAKGAMPRWLRVVGDFYFGAVAKLMGRTLEQVRDWLDTNAHAGTAVGASGGAPDWLDEHARDLGTHRQETENDTALQARLRTPGQAITRTALEAGANEILTGAGIGSPAVVLELPEAIAHFGDFAASTGTGGTFAVGATFQGTSGWNPPVTLGDLRLVISGASNAANNGTFAITGFAADAVTYVNAGAVAGLDASATWSVRKYDVDGNPLDGFGRAHMGRGYRMGKLGPCIVLILPYGTSAATQAAVIEMLRNRKGAGVRALVERRLVP